MDKRGISAVVATVLIILITVAAVTIIWAAIIPMIKEQADTTCLDAVSQVSIGSEGGYTCVGQLGNGNLSVQVGRNAGEFNLAGFQVIISVAGDTYSNETKILDTDLGVNENKVLQLDVTDFPSAVNITTADKVEIAPIVTVGNKEKTCEVASSASLSAC